MRIQKEGKGQIREQSETKQQSPQDLHWDESQKQ